MAGNELPFESIEEDLQTYELGRELLPIVRSPAWQTMKETLQSQVADINDTLKRLSPGDPQVPYVHAGLNLVDQVVVNFIKGIENAADFAQKPSEELKNYLSGALKDQDVLSAMGQRS